MDLLVFFFSGLISSLIVFIFLNIREKKKSGQEAIIREVFWQFYTDLKEERLFLPYYQFKNVLLERLQNRGVILDKGNFDFTKLIRKSNIDMDNFHLVMNSSMDGDFIKNVLAKKEQTEYELRDLFYVLNKNPTSFQAIRPTEEKIRELKILYAQKKLERRNNEFENIMIYHIRIYQQKIKEIEDFFVENGIGEKLPEIPENLKRLVDLFPPDK